MPRDIYNVNIDSQIPLVSPEELKKGLPVNDDLVRIIVRNRDEVTSILRHDDDRFLVITGPCSIHDPAAALDQLNQAGYQVTDSRQTLQELAVLNATTPKTLYAAMQAAAPSAPPPTGLPDTPAYHGGVGFKMSNIEIVGEYFYNRFDTANLPPSDGTRSYDWDYVAVRVAFAFGR